GIIVAAAKLNRAICKNVTNGQAKDLLEAARGYARPVNAERLGAVGPDAFADYAYAWSSGVARFGSLALRAEVPFVVETWAKENNRNTCLFACINRTRSPATSMPLATSATSTPSAADSRTPSRKRRARRTLASW